MDERFNVNLSIRLDQNSINSVKAQLDDLTKSRTIDIGLTNRLQNAILSTERW